MTTFPIQSSRLLGDGGLGWKGLRRLVQQAGKGLGRLFMLWSGPGRSVPQGASQLTPSEIPKAGLP